MIEIYHAAFPVGPNIFAKYAANTQEIQRVQIPDMPMPEAEPEGEQLTDEMIARLRTHGIVYARPDEQQITDEALEQLEMPRIAFEPFTVTVGGHDYKAFHGPTRYGQYWWMLKDARGKIHDGTAANARNARKAANRFVERNTPKMPQKRR
jgi:hypothetical protein